MLKAVIKNVIMLVILVMAFECISAAFLPSEGLNANEACVYKKPSTPSLLASVILEKAEEESKTEEESDKFVAIVLVDFSRVAFELSNIHSHNIPDLSVQQPFNVERPIFKMLCSFLI
jgi:hypothetical protein